MQPLLNLFLLATLSTLGSAQGQEPETIDGGDTTVEEPDEVPVVPLPLPPAPENKAAQEILELFQKVDQSLGAIDNMLFDLGAGERPLEAPEDSGLGQLLELTRAASRSVVEDIDRILELAEQMSQKSQSSSGGGGQQQKPGGKSQNNQGKPDDQGDPNKDKPQPKEQGNGEEDQPKPQGQSPGSEKQSDQESQSKPKPGDMQHPTGAGSQADATERWGELPERVRETFRNQGGEAAPLYYRDWIDSYYRHLGQRDG